MQLVIALVRPGYSAPGLSGSSGGSPRQMVRKNFCACSKRNGQQKARVGNSLAT